MKIKILYIGNKLAKHGMTVTSIETLGVFLTREGFPVIYASSKRSKILRLLEMLYKTIKHKKEVDYVLIDTYSTRNFWYAFFVSQLCRLLNLKYVPKLHGGDLPKRLLKSPVLSKMIFENAYKNIAPSLYLYEAFSNKGYAEILYIPNTIELEKYPFTHRAVITPKLLWVRSFTTIYNPEMAIRVFSLLKKEFPNAELCMVGPDKDGTLKKIQKLSDEKQLNVKFTGRLTKEEWISLSKNYDIFINTTHFDNTPVSVIEAMALGLPVVSTNVGGISYLLENNKTALLVNDNDSEAMVVAIKQLLKDDSLKQTLVQNASLCVQEFDWQVVKNKWTHLLVR